MSLTKNQRIELLIDGITAQGSGVGHHDGMAVFVPNTAVGDEIIAHIVKVNKNYAYAKVHEILKPSPDRIEPDCCVFSQCGGCAFRHITYEAELKIKQQKVRDAFRRIGHIDIEPQPIIAAKQTNFYRNKAQYPVGFDDALKIGFYAPNSHRIINCRDCRLQPPVFEEALRIFDWWISENNISIYDEKSHSGLLRHIYLRQGFATDELMVCAVINGDSLPKSDILTDALSDKLPELKSVVVNINKSDTNVILGERCKTVWGDGFITDVLCGLKFRISPLSFYQINARQAEKLYNKARDYANLTGTETVADLYCGTGTIGLTMARDVKELIGIEIIPQAVEDAKLNARLNGIENARFICSDAAQAADELQKDGIKPNVILVDPPRKGCSPELIETIAQMNPKRVVYISCDPATLARDCGIFREKGYEVQEATPVDMFPRTVHVESIILMTNCGQKEK